MALLGLDVLEGKRTETNNDEKIRVKKASDESEANKYKSNCQSGADAYVKKRQADAELNRAKAEVEVWKAKVLDEMRNSVQEMSEAEPTAESPVGNQTRNETFMQTFNRKQKMPELPSIIDEVLAGYPERKKIPMLFALLSEFGALCFSMVRTKGWDRKVHGPNIQVVIEGSSCIGKGSIFSAFKTVFQRIIDKDIAKGEVDAKKEKKHHIIQYVGANITNARLMQLFRENKGVMAFVFNEEIKGITRSLKNQRGITYDMLRKAFDNGTTDGSSSRGNTNPTPADVRMNYVFTGTIGDVKNFISGEIEGGTAMRIIWAKIDAGNDRNENITDLDQETLLQYLDDIDDWRSHYCYTTDSDGNDQPCSETMIDLEYVKAELEKWCQKQESSLQGQYADVRKKAARRMTDIALHCAIVLHMLYLCQMGNDEFWKRSVIRATLFIADYCMEKYIVKFGEEELAIIERDCMEELVPVKQGSSICSTPMRSQRSSLPPEIIKQILSLYHQGYRHKKIAGLLKKKCPNISNSKVRTVLQKEGLMTPNKA